MVATNEKAHSSEMWWKIGVSISCIRVLAGGKVYETLTSMVR